MAGVPRALLAGRDRYRLATSAPRTAWGFQSRWRTARGVAIHDRCSLAHPNDTTPVVLLHGCGGVSPQLERWARWLADRGYVGLVIDSFGPRRVIRPRRSVSPLWY